MTAEQKDSLQVIVRIGADDVREFEEYASRLRDEINEREIGTASFLREEGFGDSKTLDPTVIGGIVVAVGPVLLTKLLELLHEWVARRAARTLRVRVQTHDGASVEVEVPAASSRAEVEEWIRLTCRSLEGRSGRISLP